MRSALHWDIFCQVIDNHGDIGVCWRLARQLAGRGMQVRLWVDDARALRWMAPEGCAGVQVLPWTQPLEVAGLTPGDVLIEAFGCEVPPAFVNCYRRWREDDGRRPAWINLEYLSAESYVERSHGLPSPVMSGAGRGLTKHFFYPGFTAATGGLLREDELLARQARFDAQAWRASLGVPAQAGQRVVSLFCYEPSALPELIQQLDAPDAPPTHLLVTAGRASAAVRACPQPQRLALSFLPFLTQDDYDHLLWASDLNFVRGEDSLVRALWAGRPLVWHIYPQHDEAHHAKLEAWLGWMQAPPSLRAFHRVWNGVDDGPLPLPQLDTWGVSAMGARQRLLAERDLVSRLQEFVQSIRAPSARAMKKR